MWSPMDAPEPIEKIRKPQWTVENTRVTQAVVDQLSKARDALVNVGLDRSHVAKAIAGAMKRLCALDPKVRL